LERPVTHLDDDDLVLHYYGEDAPRAVDVESHLKTCAACARAYDGLARSLNAVTAPDPVEAPELPALRQLLHSHSREYAAPLSIAVVWLAALLYPLSLQALFGSAQWARTHAAGAPLAALAALWTCGGPLAAMYALNRSVVARVQHVSTRLLVAGALMAAVSPALFVLVSRVNASLPLNLGVGSWVAALALGALLAAPPWPGMPHSSSRFLFAHRVSALLLTVFVLGHVVNQALAFISVPLYSAMRSVMQIASQQPVSYVAIVAAVGLQMATGMAMGMKRLRAGALGRNLQVVTGWYLAAFLLLHVFSPYLFGPPSAAVVAAAASPQFNQLATLRSTAQLPFLLLGVAAFLFHVGVYARLVALMYLPEARVRRLSYAGAAVATAVVVSVGLSLCGIHLIR
jgi:succinate dehydrogenase/fumarate reductase cytochrome b subunit